MKRTTEKAKWEVERAAQEAVNVIAASAKQAAQVIADAAASAIELNNKKNADGNSDHDLIIKLDTKMDGLKEDIKNLNDGTTKQINDHETRIRSNSADIIVVKTQIKVWGSAILLVMALIQIALHFFR